MKEHNSELRPRTAEQITNATSDTNTVFSVQLRDLRFEIRDVLDLVEDLVYSIYMKQVNVHDAKTRLSELLKRVEGGEEITIARAGRPIAKLAPVRNEKIERRPGTAKGKVVVQKNFDDALLAALLHEFEG